MRKRLVAASPRALPPDVLSGIKAAQTAALPDAITQYASGVIAPEDQSNDNAAALKTVMANVDKLAGRRQQVQLAAERACPWRVTGVTATRQFFPHPTSRPLPG